jgi:thymidine phosphorylase
VKIGERIEKGAPLGLVYANDRKALAEAKVILAKAIRIGSTAPSVTKLIDEIIG